MIDEHVEVLVKDLGLEMVSKTVLGGKRLRGVLTLLVCEALGGTADKALDAAVAVEIAHAASLDLDDIIDLDEIRRGKPATWVLRGVGKTVLSSHLLVASSLRIIERYGEKAVQLAHKAYHDMVRGELFDASGDGFYEEIIKLKTAPLWGVAAGLGAIAAGASDIVGKAWEYGTKVGMAFQVADDVKDILTAVDEGKIQQLLKNPSSIAFLAWIGMKTVIQYTPLQILFKGIKSVIDTARELALKKLDEMVEKARKAADALPAVNDEYKKLLKQYPELAVQLMLERG